MDKLFMRIELAEKLTDDYHLSMIGTFRKKQQISTHMKITRHRERIMFAFQQKSTLISLITWRNKNIFMLYTIHRDNDAVDTETVVLEILLIQRVTWHC